MAVANATAVVAVVGVGADVVMADADVDDVVAMRDAELLRAPCDGVDARIGVETPMFSGTEGARYRSISSRSSALRVRSRATRPVH